MTSERQQYVEGILASVAKMDLETLRLAYYLCLVPTLGPTDLARLQEKLGPDTLLSRVADKLKAMVRVGKTSDGMWHAYFERHGAWTRKEDAEWAAGELRTAIDEAVRDA